MLRRRRPTSKGHAERTIGYLETSFGPLRTFTSLADLQAQHDAWAAEVAFGRRLRRTGTTVAGGWAVERGHLPADVVLLADHGRAVRLARDAGMSTSTASELVYLSRALKAPRIGAVSGRLAERARDEGWDHETYLAAVLAEEVSLGTAMVARRG